MRTLYISDLDGTLLNSRKEITDYSSEIINSCLASGVIVFDCNCKDALRM